MAYCDQRQIDAAYRAWRPAMNGHDDPSWAEDLDTRALKRGWNSGYTLGEDHGFGRGWEAAMSWRRTRATRWRVMQRPAYRKLALRRLRLTLSKYQVRERKRQ